MVSRANSVAFVSVFKETFGSHLIGVGGLVAGFIIAWQLGLFRSAPWVFALYPVVLIGKIVLNGVLTGRLNTALNVGTISPKFKGNLKPLSSVLHRALTLTLLTSIVMAVVSALFAGLVWKLPAEIFLDALLVTIATMSLGLLDFVFVLPFTFSVFKKDLDLDSVAYPVTGMVADIFITVCYAVVISLFLSFGGIGRSLVVLIVVLAVAMMLILLPQSIRVGGFLKAVKNSAPGLVLVGLIASVTGAILQEVSVSTKFWEESNTFYALALFAAYPALVELVGDASIVIGSTATARIVLGMLKPNFSTMKDHGLQILGAWAASALAFVLFAIVSLVVAGSLQVSTFGLLASLLLLTNLFAMIGMILISYSFSILTFKKGLDPDHLVTPLEASLAGTLTTAGLLVASYLVLGLRG
jgi:mgtE-like transporter